MAIVHLLLFLAALVCAQDSAAPAGAPSFSGTLESACNSSLVVYAKTFFNLSQPNTQPATVNCLSLGQETVPAAYLGTGSGTADSGPNVTVGTCLWWPGLIEPGAAARGPSLGLPVWQVAATLADGRALRYAAEGERFYSPSGATCEFADTPSCLSFQRVRRRCIARLACAAAALWDLAGAAACWSS